MPNNTWQYLTFTYWMLTPCQVMFWGCRKQNWLLALMEVKFYGGSDNSWCKFYRDLLATLMRTDCKERDQLESYCSKTGEIWLWLDDGRRKSEERWSEHGCVLKVEPTKFFCWRSGEVWEKEESQRWPQGVSLSNREGGASMWSMEMEDTTRQTLRIWLLRQSPSLDPGSFSMGWTRAGHSDPQWAVIQLQAAPTFLWGKHLCALHYGGPGQPCSPSGAHSHLPFGDFGRKRAPFYVPLGEWELEGDVLIPLCLPSCSCSLPRAQTTGVGL